MGTSVLEIFVSDWRWRICFKGSSLLDGALQAASGLSWRGAGALTASQCAVQTSPRRVEGLHNMAAGFFQGVIWGSKKEAFASSASAVESN